MCALLEPLRDILCADYSIIIIIYYDVLWYFFLDQFLQKNVFFCVLAEENQEALSEKCSPVSGVLQGLVKICKKYMEVNLYLLLSCSTLIL